MQKLAVALPCLGMLWALAWEVARGQKAQAPFLRLSESVSHLRLAPNGKSLAYTDHPPAGPERLRVLELSSRQIFTVSDKQVGGAYVWAPHGFRLLYREQFYRGKASLKASPQVTSEVFAYDTSLAKSLPVISIPAATGWVSLDPRTLQLAILSTEKLYTHKIRYPDSRLARWQLQGPPSQGQWCVTQNGVLWVAAHTQPISRMQDDGSAVAAFAISADGKAIAWSTTKNNLYVSQVGGDSQSLGVGRHPHWHPERYLLVYAAGRMVGQVAVSYDLRVLQPGGPGWWLTHSQHRRESWPQWLPDGERILYTAENTSDLYLEEFNLDAPLARAPSVVGDKKF